ncbi:universal stress protein [Azoarcus sp. KH32C]|uniref:universal stress protein n=1 Tax=Azoarcus sp. KH32C TaxID=748247 RepID=UPI0002385E1C|nr:universal stress protein [Azoarcus sp. KH32C]BAL27207.1 universal stress protein [Azoarcus sp. KH32C]
MFGHLLVPIDGSELSQQTVEKAVVFAREIKAHITFFFVRADVEASVYGDAALLRSTDPEIFEKAADEEARSILMQAQVVANSSGINSEVLSAISDHPYEAIIAAAENRRCDLIVMASHGRRGIKGVVLGSQTQKVLTHSKFPVLVYR